MPRRTEKSQAAFKRASSVLVGGVNSPVRAFSAVATTPPTIAKAAGSRVTDIDANTYIDYVGSYGPAILGHAPEQVVTAITKQVLRGTSYGAPTEVETRLAEAIAAAVDSVEKVRFVSSGTEAVMTAVRVARGATGRAKIVKCVGGYHGHADALLVAAGSGATTLGIPSSPGVPPGATAETILVEYNSLSDVQAAFDANSSQIAAVLVEPIAGNMGVVPPAEGYLQGLRETCDSHGALLVFDEVMTGFRVAYGGAQTLYGVSPDITTLGKIIGGGMPVGAICGPRDILSQFAPSGPIYQAGTLSGNPVAMAAGLATIKALQADGFYEQLERKSSALAAGLAQAADQAGLADKVCFNRVGSMGSLFFTGGPVTDYTSATASNLKAFAAYFRELLSGGVYIAPSQFEAMFVSARHSEDDITRTIEVAGGALSAAKTIG